MKGFRYEILAAGLHTAATATAHATAAHTASSATTHSNLLTKEINVRPGVVAATTAATTKQLDLRVPLLGTRPCSRIE